MSVYPDNVREQDIEVLMMSIEEQQRWETLTRRTESLSVMRSLVSDYNADMPNDELHSLTEALDDAIGIMQEHAGALTRGD